MIPYGHQTINKDDISEVVKVLKSDWLTQGPKVIEFEKALADYCGAKYAVAASSGTAALHLAYLAADLKPGDEIITSPNTFAATANMLLAVGAKPVFCDIRLDNYNIDETKIENLITPKTKAIVPIHFSGQACEMDRILKLAKKNKLLVIEDACHALGAKYKNRKIGSLDSALTVFSFHPVKSITTGEGGAVLTNNKKYYAKMLLLRSHGIYKNKQGRNVMVELGYNYRLTELGAALGLNQLKRLNHFIKARRKIVGWYKHELAGVQEIILPKESAGVYSAWHLYVIRIINNNRRDQLASYLKDRGIGVNFHYPAVYRHPFYQKSGYKNIKLPNEEKYCLAGLTLPCYPGLTLKEVSFIGSKIRDFFKKFN